MHLGCMRTLAIDSNVREGAACSALTTLPATASKPTMKPTIIGERIGIVSSSSQAQLILERQLPDAPAGGGENRVRHRGSGDGCAWFADSAWRFQVAHQVHLDGRRLVDSHDSNVMEVGLLDPAVLERHAAPQDAADSEDYPALGLGLHRVRVYDRPAIDCADNPVDADLARLRHRDLGHLRQITAPFAEKHRDAAAAAFGQRRSPSGRLRGDVQDCRRARRFAKKGPAKRGGILLRGCGELVDETLNHEVVVRDSDASPEPGFKTGSSWRTYSTRIAGMS